MDSTIDLLWLSQGTPPPAWSFGRVRCLPARLPALGQAAAELFDSSAAGAALFWDGSLGPPNEGLLQELVASPCDCWHAGLALGAARLPRILDFISPAWMLSCDPPRGIEATSWRMSLRACLVRMEVWRKLGGLRPGFHSLEAAALEMGHRWLGRGALMRHVPRLLGSQVSPVDVHAPSLSFEDELRFAYHRFGPKWAGWAVVRSVMTRYVALPAAVSAWRKVASGSRPPEPAPFRPVSASVSFSRGPSQPSAVSVSVLIPTVDRYPYLRTLLDQLRRQTIPPLEIIVVDQTAAGRRQHSLAEDFSDLPLQWIFQDEPGQCTSRNAGLQMARGDHVLFIDDDDEVPCDLIESHLSNLARFGAEVSCGVAEEVGAGALPADFRLIRASDVFPTNNTMIRREVLQRSGLFDLAYNRAQRADGDLGTRIYLAGALMVLNPDISVLHHHAPSGGLRKHKARTVTYAMSRSHLRHRALTSASEIYLAGRYFPSAQLREVLWQSVLGTFSIRGGPFRKLAKILAGALALPCSIWELRGRLANAREMASQFPQIPVLNGSPSPVAHFTPPISGPRFPCAS